MLRLDSSPPPPGLVATPDAGDPGVVDALSAFAVGLAASDLTKALLAAAESAVANPSSVARTSLLVVSAPVLLGALAIDAAIAVVAPSRVGETIDEPPPGVIPLEAPHEPQPETSTSPAHDAAVRLSTDENTATKAPAEPSEIEKAAPADETEQKTGQDTEAHIEALLQRLRKLDSPEADPSFVNKTPVGQVKLKLDIVREAFQAINRLPEVPARWKEELARLTDWYCAGTLFVQKLTGKSPEPDHKFPQGASIDQMLQQTGWRIQQLFHFFENEPGRFKGTDLEDPLTRTKNLGLVLKRQPYDTPLDVDEWIEERLANVADEDDMLVLVQDVNEIDLIWRDMRHHADALRDMELRLHASSSRAQEPGAEARTPLSNGYDIAVDELLAYRDAALDHVDPWRSAIRSISVPRVQAALGDLLAGEQPARLQELVAEVDSALWAAVSQIDASRQEDEALVEHCALLGRFLEAATGRNPFAERFGPREADWVLDLFDDSGPQVPSYSSEFHPVVERLAAQAGVDLARLHRSNQASGDDAKHQPPALGEEEVQRLGLTMHRLKELQQFTQHAEGVGARGQLQKEAQRARRAIDLYLLDPLPDPARRRTVN